MRRALVLATCLMLGGAGAALADQPPARPSTGASDVYSFSTGRGRLGMVVVGLTDELKQFYGAGQNGALVGKVERGSPAEKAGLKVGDVLVSVAGKPIDDASDVISLLSGKRKGDNVAVVVIRNHTQLTLNVQLTSDAPAAMPQGWSEPQLGDMDQDLEQDLQQMQQQIQRLEQRVHRLDGA